MGKLLLAGTERGVCRVAFGEQEAALAAELAREFPAAELSREDRALRQWMESLLAGLAGAEPRTELPLDIRATAFQALVYQALREIPRGSTLSYGELAAAIGRPGAARAVGRACATNPVAVLIPCHRAVAGDGRLTGYRWGLERKARLLEREREALGQEEDRGGRR